MIHLLRERLKKLASEQTRQVSFQGDENVLCIDHYHVLLGTLDDSPPGGSGSVPHQIEALYKRALEVRKELTQAGASDLYLFVVGPSGSAMSPDWESQACEIELDERICRRLVWLPDEGGENLDVFIRRTFLARPWEQVQTGTVHTLGKLTRTVDMPPEWIAVLLETDLEGRELVQSLMEKMGDE